MKITVLASGSKGNATFLEFGDDHYLVDCGISYRQIKVRLEKQGKNLERLKGVFITHEHSDHINGLRVLLNKHQVPIYLSEGTYKGFDKRYMGPMNDWDVHYLREEEIMNFNAFSLLPFNTYHDAIEPMGFKFIEDNRSFVYITDTGYFPLRKYDLIRNADAYMVESNYESEMLLESARPWSLKRRILDDQGHLSNEDSANMMLEIIGEKTKILILAHLSEECNESDIAVQTYEMCFNVKSHKLEQYKLYIAKQHDALEEITLG
jgi:phosphoribosyl 1,2-cyclic phosphodiesterase